MEFFSIAAMLLPILHLQQIRDQRAPSYHSDQPYTRSVSSQINVQYQKFLSKDTEKGNTGLRLIQIGTKFNLGRVQKIMVRWHSGPFSNSQRPIW